jgi:hypothetical protein
MRAAPARYQRRLSARPPRSQHHRLSLAVALVARRDNWICPDPSAQSRTRYRGIARKIRRPLPRRYRGDPEIAMEASALSKDWREPIGRIGNLIDLCIIT